MFFEEKKLYIHILFILGTEGVTSTVGHVMTGGAGTKMTARAGTKMTGKAGIKMTGKAGIKMENQRLNREVFYS